MELLAGTLYDPATAASVSCNALAAMTALDTTNLRLTFTVPASGIVRVRIRSNIIPSAVCPRILLGVLESTTVKGRVNPFYSNPSSPAIMSVDADFLVTGLTPAASLTWDAAFGVEEATFNPAALKWGGPNNSTTNDAWGGFAFEVWDPVGSGGGGGGLTEADVRDAVGLASANLDDQFSALADELDALLSRVRRLSAHGDGKARVSQNPK